MSDSSASAERDAVRVPDLRVSFGGLRAVDSLALRVPEGSVTGLIGRNGAGKSTTIRVLAGLLAPDPGSGPVEVLGGRFPADRLRIRRETGYLLAEPALFPYLTPAETLRFLGAAYGIPDAEARRRAEELLDFFGLEEAADRIVDDFSTGMRKRLELAAALIHRPRLLVLDEPFESLDPLMVRALKQLLLRYRDAGGSVLLSSHLIDAVDEICDRIVILERGRVVAAGPTEEAKARVSDELGSGTLEELYASLVPDREGPALDWLTEEPRGGGG
jgi:ABC-2 type transport system ATP-binding protein